jgi:hypothetical protein
MAVSASELVSGNLEGVTVSGIDCESSNPQASASEDRSL